MKKEPQTGANDVSSSILSMEGFDQPNIKLDRPKRPRIVRVKSQSFVYSSNKNKLNVQRDKKRK